LGAWVGRQRVAKTKNKLRTEREEKLNSIRFVWKLRCTGQTDWNTRFEELVEYKQVNGDCNVSTKDSQNIELGRWVSKQRLAKNKFLLSEERERKLSSIGFLWKAICVTDWDIRLEQLVEYKKANGDFNVPTNDSQHIELWRWVSKQRDGKNKFRLTEERERKLNSIGFVWNITEKADRWDARFRQLLEYKQVNGDCNVSTKDSQNIELGRWVSKQRLAKNKFLLSEERERKLNSIGFFLNIVSSKVDWDLRFRELLLYFQTHGDFNVPPCYPRNPLLASWVSERRNDYDLKRRGGEQTSLTPLREAKLDAIGFTWIFGGTEEDALVEVVSSASVRPEEIRSGTKVKSENVGVAVPDSIPSG
jgi:hypothetical protein